MRYIKHNRQKFNLMIFEETFEFVVLLSFLCSISVNIKVSHGDIA